MSNPEYKICLLIVTYGNRWHLLEQVLKRVTGFDKITNVIVVNNASAYNVENKVKQVDGEKIVIINNKENMGSAGGYKMAMEYAVNNTDADMFFLLDDDNLPGENVVDELLSQWNNMAGAANKKALFCLREDRPQHVMIAKGEDPYRFYLVPDNFLGFNVLRIFHNRFYKLRDKFSSKQAYKSRVQMPYVPYGGLLLHRAIIMDIGYPDERFFLYVDDSEYTYRITQNEGTIWLIPSCKIVDIDTSQGLTYKKKIFHSQLLDQWNFRVYYHIRNRMFFYSNNFSRNKFIFKINKALYLGYLKIIALLGAKYTEYNKLLIAVKDGLNGDLGKADAQKF